ncbi:thiolase family protein [Phenylobacterium sp.]|uniref:thiolase family protein n=1 Tax=Phenylobacterium sp. TaxID=1871053 RepID=UPI002FC6F9A3
MQQAVIAGYVRTPFHFARKGALAGVRPDDLAATAIRALIQRTGVDPATLEDVILGCSFPEGAQGDNVARIASLLAGLPVEVSGMTVNRFCGSSMSAIHIAIGQIAIGAGDAFVAGGVESMSQVPPGGLSSSPNPMLMQAYVSMGETAENVAAQHRVTRAEQEALAFASQQKAGAAQAAGRLRAEIAGVMTDDGLIDTDGCLRPETTLEGLAGLKPAFRPEGTVTAGTSSPLTDGASATLITSAAYAAAHGLEPLALVRAVATAGCPPEIMGMGPVPATRKALARAGLTIDDIDIVEINEAFGSQAVACIRELNIPLEKVNLDGGGLAIGHPLGATGARITGKAAQILKREGKRFALSTQCIGGGQGIATILEAA